MTTFAVIVNTLDVEQVAENVRLLTLERIRSVTLPAVNEVIIRGFGTARKAMLSGVNLTDAYVKERMDVELATEADPEATIIAFRKGGRRPAIRGVNLRQYGAVVVKTPVAWPNDNRLKGRLPNPRKPGAFLPFIPRIGHNLLSIPVGYKQAGVSVEVKTGARKLLANAFLQRMPNGQTLVMERLKGSATGKGKIRALSSLSVWQLFRRQIPAITPKIKDDLTKTIGLAIEADVRKVFK